MCAAATGAGECGDREDDGRVTRGDRGCRVRRGRRNRCLLGALLEHRAGGRGCCVAGRLRSQEPDFRIGGLVPLAKVSELERAEQGT